MISFENHIIFDTIESWPTEMLKIIKDNKRSLKGYFEEEHRIDRLMQKNVFLRYDKPKNTYRNKWDSVIQDIENILNQHSIIGIHCTKLLDWEIKDIEETGLKPLDRTFANKRVEKAFKAKLISKELKTKLIDKKELSEVYKKGCIWFFHCLDTLKDENGVNKFLGLWGGESLYNSVKNNQELKNIGIPCIVFTSIKINELDMYPKLSERMISFYFNDNCFVYDNDSVLNTNLKVLRIVRRDEEIFNILTGIENWDDKNY